MSEALLAEPCDESEHDKGIGFENTLLIPKRCVYCKSKCTPCFTDPVWILFHQWVRSKEHLNIHWVWKISPFLWLGIFLILFFINREIQVSLYFSNGGEIFQRGLYFISEYGRGLIQAHWCVVVIRRSLRV